MQVEINDDYIDEIIRQELTRCYQNMTYRHESNTCVFSHDKDEEMEHIYTLRKALRLVINYYSLTEDRIEEPLIW